MPTPADPHQSADPALPCILVVEDEMMVLMMIEDMLADLGCEAVVVAATTDQAIDLINTHVFDAAMLDMNLNSTKNSSIADALAAHGVPFIFSTGYSGHNMRDGYPDRPILKKPFQFEELAAFLTRLLAR